MRTLWLCGMIALALLGCAKAEPPRAVILKLDDLGGSAEIHPGWVQAMEYLEAENLVGTIGVIGGRMESLSPEGWDWLRARQAEGHEIWNHGWCHCKPEIDGGEEGREFRGTSRSFQRENLQRAQDFIKANLGVTMTAFGAPYNSTDANTVLAVRDVPELRVWMFKDPIPSMDMTFLPRTSELNIEYPVHVPDFDAFKKGYAAHPDQGLLVLQGHPRSWIEDPARFDNFKQIVAFLKSEGFVFTTPSAGN